MSSPTPTSPTWTPSQSAAIHTVGQPLLVSAGAGSGKTAVLTQRVVHLLSHHRLHLSQLLVVTFTEAAASEMKRRIARSLATLAAETPADDPLHDHLNRQSLLVDSAPILTIDAFCSRLVRRHFAEAGLSPQIDIIDPTHASLMQYDAARRAIARTADSNCAPALSQLLDGYYNESVDSLIDMIISFASFVGTMPDGPAYLHSALELTDPAQLDKPHSRLHQMLLAAAIDEVAAARATATAALTFIAARASANPGLAKRHAYIQECLSHLDLTEKHLKDHNLAAALALTPDFGRAPPVKNTGDPTDDHAKKHADAAVAAIKSACAPLGLGQSLEPHRPLLVSAQSLGQCLIHLTQTFTAEFSAAKRAAQVLDFSDVAHHALRLCQHPDGSPTAIALQLQEEFSHVLIDEYQDVNPLQDRLLSLIAGKTPTGQDRPSLFCVGDIKQSIYRFRLAEPQLFARRMDHYRTHPAAGKVIDLQSNFRSRPQILDVVNALFSRVMTTAAAEISYDSSHTLIPSAKYPENSSFFQAPVELHVVGEPPKDAEEPSPTEGPIPTDTASLPPDESTAIQRESLLVAQKIRKLLGLDGSPPATVSDKDKTRPIRPGDIAILLRSLRGHASHLTTVLRKNDIPVTAMTRGGLLSTPEVVDLLHILAALENPLQDVSLAAALRSPLLQLPAIDSAFAAAVAAYRPKDTTASRTSSTPFHIAIHRYATEASDEYAQTLAGGLAQLTQWRTLARAQGLPGMLTELFHQSHCLLYASTRPDAPQRRADLVEFRDQALALAAGPARSLFELNRLLARLADDSDLDRAPPTDTHADNTDDHSSRSVQVMSIHASKGLEFPVVFILQLGSRFNDQSLNAPALFDRTLGLGLTAVDPAHRLRIPSLPHTLIKSALKRLARAEQMRLLYVALTRAREKLYLIGTADHQTALELLSSHPSPTDPLPATTTLAANHYLQWLLPALGAARNADPTIPISFHLPSANDLGAELTPKRPTPTLPPQLATLQPVADPHPASALIYQHPLTPPTPASRLAISVSDLVKPADIESPSWHGLPAHEQSEAPVPSRREAAKLAGTATHDALQHLDFPTLIKSTNPQQELLSQLDQLLHSRLITPDQLAAIDLGQLTWFLSTPLAALLANSRLHREIPLNFTHPASFNLPPYHPAAAQPIIRGRIDLLAETATTLHLLDYKTDRVDPNTPAIADRITIYSAQLTLYAHALKQMLPQKHLQASLVFLHPRIIHEVKMNP